VQWLVYRRRKDVELAYEKNRFVVPFLFTLEPESDFTLPPSGTGLAAAARGSFTCSEPSGVFDCFAFVSEGGEEMLDMLEVEEEQKKRSCSYVIHASAFMVSGFPYLSLRR
jgi:hypothetical protein